MGLQRALVAIDLEGGSDFCHAVRAAWDAGAAVLPLGPSLPRPHRDDLVRSLGATHVVEAGDDSPRALSGGWPVEAGDALVIATSGSTGTPKGVVLTAAALDAAAGLSNHRLGAGAEAVWLACLPLHHIGGFSVLTRAWQAGARLVVHPRFDAAAVEAAARVHGVTHTSLVPTALGRIDPGVFRCILLGGSAIPTDRPTNTVATYGMTESGAGVVYDGLPLDGVGVRAADDGALELRSPTLLRCYRDGTVPLDGDGWYRTGDLGHVGPDGRVVVEGRADDLIITGAEKVWPAVVEARLLTHPGVGDVAVVGRPDPEWGTRVVALVVAADPELPPRLDALRDHVKAALPPAAAPRELVLVDRLPRTAMGKLRRGELDAP